MFAKPHWFRLKTQGPGVTPANWHGWLYLTAAVCGTLLPTFLLLGRHQGLEALIWLVVVGGFLFYELRQVRRSLLGHCVSKDKRGESATDDRATVYAPAADEGIYFLDQRDAAQRVNTARFQLSLKQ